MITSVGKLNRVTVVLQAGRPMILLSFTLACLLAGCTGSVHPLLTDDDLLKGSDLSGTWILELRDKDDKVQEIPIELDGYDTSTYDLDIPAEWLKSQSKAKTTGPKWPEAWTLQIGKIDEQLYGQVIPRDMPTGPPVAAGIPVFWLGKVSIGKETVEFYPLLDNMVDVARRRKLQHVKYTPSDFVELTVFTMSTSELQEMVTKHGNELFSSKPMVLRKSSATTK